MENIGRSYLQDYTNLLKMTKTKTIINEMIGNLVVGMDLIESDRLRFKKVMATINDRWEDLVEILAKVAEKRIPHQDLRDLIFFYHEHPLLCQNVEENTMEVAKATEVWLKAIGDEFGLN